MARRRVDSNQPEIVAALRALGATVHVTSAIGKGFPDIVVGFRGNNYLIELKDGKKLEYQTKLTNDEKRFHETWRGKVHIVRSIDDALMIIKATSANDV